MVDDEVRDGSRIGALLSSEVHGRQQGALGRLSVVDADRDAAPTEEGTFAYAVEYRGSDAAGGTGHPDDAGDSGDRAGARVAEVHLHPDRVRVEFLAARETAIEAADAQGLRVGSGDDDRGGDDRGGDDQGGYPVEGAVPLEVENGAAVKPALRVVRAVAEALDEELGET